MILGTAVKDNFLDETLWVTTTNADQCWIEVGDSEFTHFQTGKAKRQYYWAENSKANGYHDHYLDWPPYVPVGSFQHYQITQEFNQPFTIVIGNTQVGVTNEPGDTYRIDVGLETTYGKARIVGAVSFRNFETFDGRAYHPWPNNPTSSANFPAWWQWNFPTAANGIPIPFLPLSQ